MTICRPPQAAALYTRSPAPQPSTTPTKVTIFGCGADEADLFRQVAPHYGVLLTMTEEAICEANAELASGSRCVSIDHKTPVTDSALRALSHAGVEYISTRSIGYNHINVGLARSIGLTIGNVGYSPDSVADYTLMLMLMATRHAKSTFRGTEEHDYRLSNVRGRELRDLTVGVIGTGRIGSAVIGRLRGFGCRILASDIFPASNNVPLNELLRGSDIITMHTPLTEYTYHLLDRSRIELMKGGAYIINTGRGPLLDTEALVSALENGKLGGAALDVLEGEEGIFYTDCHDKLPEESLLARLQSMPNVIITPHTAYYTDHALNDMIENSLANCLKFESENIA